EDLQHLEVDLVRQLEPAELARIGQAEEAAATEGTQDLARELAARFEIIRAWPQLLVGQLGRELEQVRRGLGGGRVRGRRQEHNAGHGYSLTVVWANRMAGWRGDRSPARRRRAQPVLPGLFRRTRIDRADRVRPARERDPRLPRHARDPHP